MPLVQDSAILRSGAYIDGRWITSENTYPIINPVNGKQISSVSRCDAADVQRAIDGASRAFRAWRSVTAKERARVLRRWFELMIAHQRELATIITLEQGKPLAEASAEIDYAASFVDWFSEEAKRTYGDVIPAPRGNTRIVVLREPVGVCAAITPWNFPAAMITRKAAPALAAGCSIIVKPAPQTPLTALALAELGSRAGLPPGVLNIVTGDENDSRMIGKVLCDSEAVRKLTFTGSTATGRLLLEQSAATIKRVSLELGGNAPFIVFDDAQLDTAVEQLLVAKYRNTGQSCIGANRVLVHGAIYDEFVNRFAERSRQLKVGDGMTAGIDIGPLINQEAVGKLEALIADAVSRGARVVCGGARSALGGTFFQPTVLRDVLPSMRIASEEVFGPVTPIYRFDTEENALELANATCYGLASYLFSESADRIWSMAGRLESGMVGINCGMISNEMAPFGGVKQSGLGREGSYLGINEFLEPKYLCWTTNRAAQGSATP